ncbi:hypothetical protein [Limnoglobus roseus]|uniref:RNA polymerase sigma factor n=1 Tax=Limnoglobus roseus TaxID=2598579 RepID=A0A5C1ACV0_9BACT|nr:hypothetical protein [Limnoglobus roseus]QEL14878.1 RNA polymerase sigma factor [Limnoglobus roseus]
MSRLLLPALAFGLLAGTLSAAPVKDSAPTPGAKLRQALDETGDVVFEGKTLAEVAAFFKNKVKAEVRYDTAAMMGLGIDPNAPTFAVKVRDGKIRDGLKAVLSPANLSYGVVGGAIFIGPEETVIQQQMRQRVNLDGEATTLSALLKSLADESGANVVLDPRIEENAKKAAIKLKLTDVPLETAVRLTAEVAGFGTVRMNNVLFVTSEERAERLKAVADGPTPIPAAPVPFPAVPPGTPAIAPLPPAAGGR